MAIILVCVYGIIGLPTSKAQLLDNLKNNIRLGLDLKGGSQLMLQVKLQDAFKADAGTVVQRLQDELRKASIDFQSMTPSDPQTLADADKIQIDVRGIPATKAGDFRTIFNDNFNSAWILTPVGSTDYRLTMQQSYALKLKDDTLTQTINTIDKKINGLGLSESSVQKRGGSNSEAEILVQLPGVDDPAHVKQILQTQAMLELDEVKGGPFSSREDAQASNGGILPLDSQIVRSLARNGAPVEYYILGRTPVVTGRDIRDAKPQQNGQNGSWETSFVLSQDAAKRFERFTGANIGKPLAIVLDKLVLSAPRSTRRSAITV